MRIYLVGYMGSGKSTLGRKIADFTGMNFIDLDKYIEERYFKSIPIIFEEEGETGFRRKEQYSLHEVSQFENLVISTGGGTPCFFDNMELMNKTGITIYIAPDIDTLASRIVKSKTERPLVTGKSHEELLSFIKEALKIRSPFYEQAQIILSNENNLHPEAVIEAINKIKKSRNHII